MRFRLTLEFDGGPFFGWQRQDNGPSIQGALEDAIHETSGEWVTVYGAGRTDSGVHALGMVAHFDLEKPFTADKIRDALNHHLKPAPIAVLHAACVSDDFHARFSAKARHYVYRIICRRAPLVLERGHAWQVARMLDVPAMHHAAQSLLGQHDFTTFRAAECQAKSPIKTLDRLDVQLCGEGIQIRASARSFLHHQVRSMVGSLKHVGEGKWSPADMAKALAARDRTACGTVAPPDGLYFSSIDY